MKWTKIMAHRKMNFLFTHPVLVGLSQNFNEGLFVWNREGYTDFMMLTEEIWEESRRLSQKIKDDPRYVDEYRNYSLEVCGGAIDGGKEISRIDVGAADGRTLGQLARRLFEMLEKVGTTIIQTRFDAYEQVKKYALDKHLSPGDLRILIAPPELSLLAKSQMQLLKIVHDHERGMLTDGEFGMSLDEHVRAYRWVTTDVGFGIPLTLDDLRQQVARMKSKGSIAEEYEQLSKYSTGIADAKESLLGRLDPPPHIRHLMTALADESFFRQYRRDTYSQAEYYARPLFEEVARRTGLTLAEVYYLTPDEVYSFLLDGRAPVTVVVHTRMREGVIFRIYSGQTEVISGKAAGDLVSQELGDEDHVDFSSVHFVEGEIAYPGRARGTAKVITSEADLDLVRHGDIFIATQATPNLINRIIDKVSAIVTDEGDITSHASLVAWEHQLPCVVGTQNATKAFRTGDSVEVDAEKSITERAVVRKM